MRPRLFPETGLVVEQLECRIGFGRSSRYGFRRHRVMRAADYEKLLSSPDAAVRGRALRMLGKTQEALAELARAIRRDPSDAAAHAWRWELGLARAVLREKVDFADIDRAIALEPRNALWLAWRGIGKLSYAPYSSTRALTASGRRRLMIASNSALQDFSAALALDKGCVLAHVGRAVAFESLKRWADLVSALDAAIELEPREGWLYLFRAVIRTNMGGAPDFGPDDEAAIYLDEGYPFGRFAQGRTEALTPERLIEKADGFLKRWPGRRSWWVYVFRAENRRSPPINDFTGAFEDFEKAVALKPDCPWAWAYYAKALAGAGKLAEARRAVDRSVAGRKDCGWFWIWRGEIRRRSGDPRGALRDLDRGLALDPDYELGYAWRGGARRLAGDIEGALSDLGLAVALDPRHPWTTHELSLALRAAGRVDESMRVLEDACRMDPKFGWCRDPRGAPAAIAQLDAELKRAPRSARAYAWRGEAKLTAGDLEGARRDLERCLELEPGRAWAHAWLGRTLALLKKPREALKRLDRATVLDPRYPNAFAWRGDVKKERGDLRGALADLDRAVRIDPKCAWILEWRAHAKAAAGRPSEAAADFERALQLNPRNPEAQYWRGRCLCDAGRCAEAQACFDRALALSPGHVWALIASGVCLEKSGRLEAGGKRLAEARRLDPELFERAAAAA